MILSPAQTVSLEPASGHLGWRLLQLLAGFQPLAKASGECVNCCSLHWPLLWAIRGLLSGDLESEGFPYGWLWLSFCSPTSWLQDFTTLRVCQEPDGDWQVPKFLTRLCCCSLRWAEPHHPQCHRKWVTVISSWLFVHHWVAGSSLAKAKQIQFQQSTLGAQKH